MLKNNLTLAYILFVGLPLLALIGVLQSGNGLAAPPLLDSAHPTAAGAAPAPLNLLKLILQLGVILVGSRLTGMLFRKMRQPQVIGEMVAGILLGPSLLGWAAPALFQSLFPTSSLGYLNAQAGYTISKQTQVGVGIGHIFPGEFLTRATGGSHYTYPYLMLNYAF